VHRAKALREGRGVALLAAEAEPDRGEEVAFEEVRPAGRVYPIWRNPFHPGWVWGAPD